MGILLVPVVLGAVWWQGRMSQPPADEDSVRRSVSKLIQNEGANSDAPDIEALIDETYIQVLEEVEQYETVKAQARKSVDPTKVVQWLKTSPMGKRERGQREIEHWSLVAMAVEIAGSRDPKVVVQKLSESKNPTASIALTAFREEFGGRK